MFQHNADIFCPEEQGAKKHRSVPLHFVTFSLMKDAFFILKETLAMHGSGNELLY